MSSSITDEAISRITAKVADEFGGESSAIVRRDSYRGFRVLVITPDGRDDSPSDRRRRLADALVGEDVAHVEVLTRAEAAIVGADDDAASEDERHLPLWPESLLRGQDEIIHLNLPSRSDESLEPPVVATFYSLRGGVGRSTALAHTAISLARSMRVLCIDMDLEAPGLAALLDVEDEVLEGAGVVSLLLAGEMAGEITSVDEHVIPVGQSGNLYLLPAGTPNADYARKLAQLEPAAWYREAVNPLRDLMRAVRTMRLRPDVVLIDSRTGISPLSAPLLFDVADIAVVTMFPHPQARVGTAALTRALLGARSNRRDATDTDFTPEPRFLISPVPGLSSPELKKHFEDRSVEWVREWLAPARDDQGEKVFDDVEELVHVVGYSEEVAASDYVGESTLSAYEPIAGWIAGFVGERPGERRDDEPDIDVSAKSGLLDELRFSTGTAEAQSDEDFEQTFLTTDIVERAMRSDVPLVLGRKGTGKTALFRRLAQRNDSVVVTSPPGLVTYRPWMPEAESYRAIGDELARLERDWRAAWPLLIGIALKLRAPQLPGARWVDTTDVAYETTSEAAYSNLQLVKDLRTLLGHPDAALLGVEWLREVDAALGESILLLFDGLDTGFGLETADLERRQKGIGGLLSFLMSHGDGLVSIDFKLMLREDIWRLVSVANKSHFYGREVRLAWAYQADYLRVALKQSLRSERFAEYVHAALGRPGLDLRRTAVEYWPEALVYDAWTLLVGERVSGGKTAFTYNWVWSRLSDANENHSPRALLQLFNEAVQVERRLQRSNPYERSVLRPRALVESLDEVSEQAITALREEFRELEPLFVALENVGRTPFDAIDLDVEGAVENLAREVGLLGVDIGTRDDVERYRVPELYRKALGMGRRGQA
ncbi:ParA family protein [Modestobacter versicolor]|uniref:ParA family protein n=1 Tax=Modestobacter versicolor TaxID=429133 RepID=UPI0034DFFFF8